MYLLKINVYYLMKDRNSGEVLLIRLEKGSILMFIEQQKLYMYFLFYFLNNSESGIIILISETLKQVVNNHLEI